MNEFDVNLMLALNFDGGSFMDAIIWFASGIPNWIPLYLLVMFLIWRRFGWKYMAMAFVFVAAGVGICDQVCNFFKHNIPYLRPTNDPEVAPFLHTLKGYTGGTYGTVSGHASTSFCIFLLTSLMMRRWWFTTMMLAYTIITSYSRIYLGVHFPMQILFGIILGAIVAVGLWYLFDWFNKKYRFAKGSQRE